MRKENRETERHREWIAKVVQRGMESAGCVCPSDVRLSEFSSSKPKFHKTYSDDVKPKSRRKRK